MKRNQNSLHDDELPQHSKVLQSFVYAQRCVLRLKQTMYEIFWRAVVSFWKPFRKLQFHEFSSSQFSFGWVTQAGTFSFRKIILI